MKICGSKKLRAFFSYILAALIANSRVNGVIVIRSTKPSGGGDADRFSNSSCKYSHCGIVPRRQSHAFCSTRDCCFCQCRESTPNYILSQRMCVANGDIPLDQEAGEFL